MTSPQYWTKPVICIALAGVFAAACAPDASAQRKKEYLSETEADKIREAAFSGPKIVLFAGFASDRIKKMKYEFAHMDPSDHKRAERLNSLLNGYAGCVDDAADLVGIGTEKQEDISRGVKVLQERLREFLPYLQELSASGPERETYKDNLDDAIEATQDAIKTVEDAAKDLAPPPVRRKPS